MPAVESRDAGGDPPPLLRDDVPVGDASPVLPLLREQADDWRGVPYRLGGTDRRGVDCSAFVQITFQSQLGVEVPRTTAELAREGRRVPGTTWRRGSGVLQDRFSPASRGHLHGRRSLSARLHQPWRDDLFPEQRVLAAPLLEGAALGTHGTALGGVAFG